RLFVFPLFRGLWSLSWGQNKMRTRTADRRNCRLSPADWPKIFDSSPQFLHRVAVRVLYGNKAFHIDMSMRW
ncbi:Uncharacterized protein APZ42_032125, partial [Daphnia magna]